jgi:hypothetical protein
MERNLILHIGYHRTGTKTLQRIVFPQLKRVAYFCRHSRPESATAASRQITRSFRFSPEIWRRRGEEFFWELRADMAERGFDGAALVSAESMSEPFIFHVNRGLKIRDPFLLAAHLHECGEAARKSGFERLKVIMGIRRQEQYLASYYAKTAHGIQGSGQDDFESQTLEIIDPNKRFFIDGIWLDYQAVRGLIAGAVGEERILILPIEQLEFEPATYLSGLSLFVGEPLNEDSQKVIRTNSRSIARDAWQMNLGQDAKRNPFLRLRRRLAGTAEIHLTTKLKERILATYRNSNERLASDVKLDLERYGYCGTCHDQSLHCAPQLQDQ